KSETFESPTAAYVPLTASSESGPHAASLGHSANVPAYVPGIVPAGGKKHFLTVMNIGPCAVWPRPCASTDTFPAQAPTPGTSTNVTVNASPRCAASARA